AAVELVLLLERLVLEVALGPDVALREHEGPVVVRPEELRAVDRERARERASGVGLELVGTGRTTVGGRERPLLSDDSGDTGRSGDEDRLLLERERNGVLGGRVR